MVAAVICTRCRGPIAAAEGRSEVVIDPGADPRTRRAALALCADCRRGLAWFLAGPAELPGLGAGPAAAAV